MKRLKFIRLDMDTLRSKIFQESCRKRFFLIQTFLKKMLYVILSLLLIRGKKYHNTVSNLWSWTFQLNFYSWKMQAFRKNNNIAVKYFDCLLLQEKKPLLHWKILLTLFTSKKIASELLKEIIWKMTEGLYYENVTTKFEFVVQ